MTDIFNIIREAVNLADVPFVRFFPENNQITVIENDSAVIVCFIKRNYAGIKLKSVYPGTILLI